jgi:hypothetical protein
MNAIKNASYNSGIYHTSNTGWQQELIYAVKDGSKFRFKVICESVDSQSTATAWKWSDKVGWCQIVSMNTKRDFGINIVFKEKAALTGKEFDKVFEELCKLCAAF